MSRKLTVKIATFIITIAIVSMSSACIEQRPTKETPGQAQQSIGPETDYAYLRKLNTDVHNGLLTETDKTSLWQAYLLRLGCGDRMSDWSHILVQPAF